MTLIVPTRRGFISGLSAVFAAPAIVRIESLMPVRALVINGVPVLTSCHGDLWVSLNMITRKAVRTWRNSNVYLTRLNDEYDKEFVLVTPDLHVILS